MGSKAKRVALLARPGAAGQRLADVLGEADIELVLQADPTQVEAATVMGAQPDTLLVALDAPTEDALERLEAALYAPNIDVIYEEADLVVAREGWDAARWRRHLLAKLQGHDNVLPPAQPGTAPAPAVTPAAVAAPSQGAREAMPGARALDGAAAEVAFTALGEVAATPAAETAPAPAPVTASASAEAPRTGPDTAFTTFSLQQTYDVVAEPVLQATPAPAPAPTLPAEAARDTLSSSISWSLEPGPEDAAAAEPVSDVRFDGDQMAPVSGMHVVADDELDVSAPAAGIHVPFADSETSPPSERPGSVQESAVEKSSPFDPVAAEMTDTTIAPATGTRWAEQAFVTEPQATDATPEDRFSNDLASLELRIASMSLMDDTPVRGPEKVRGAVLVLAGIGGPDAVRQLLGSLPSDFLRPVLVQQRLDGARYDRLVAQMQRATALPVKLAEPGQPVDQGTVYIIPDDVGVADDGKGLAFLAGANDILVALPAADSAVLMLSGSDMSRVDAALSFGWNGGLVVGQNIDGCYDAAAVTDLMARGGSVAKPAEMGPRLVAHWQQRG